MSSLWVKRSTDIPLCAHAHMSYRTIAYWNDDATPVDFFQYALLQGQSLPFMRHFGKCFG